MSTTSSPIFSSQGTISTSIVMPMVLFFTWFFRLCVIGLAPTHASLSEGGVTSVDFNVGKSDRSEIKVTGKRKKNAQLLEPNSALCKVYASDNIYIARCCIKGSLLEVNNRLIKEPGLLNSSPNIGISKFRRVNVQHKGDWRLCELEFLISIRALSSVLISNLS
ncbi:protein Simiate isoform X7 [Amborella trichopoda]|uniref:protein Simiate isoform X7 n=1 Tax=Amborella trichopoda TaxID=13333 RepID=UPI0009BEA2A6|nr:protein Simiate isoform X7 [Amborella trichopoda]|eukprot:XP_020519110.1 protein Simiate isoform X7 [Amborella trichopoda]